MQKKNIFIGIILLFFGFFVIYLSLYFSFRSASKISSAIRNIASYAGIRQHEVVGFLPYWLLDQADKDYSKYITTLTYFGLIINPDGTIRKTEKENEGEPGWVTLSSGKADKILSDAKNKGLKLSLLIFCGNENDIYGLVSNPEKNADSMMKEVAPIMKKYGFTDLNLDIESVESASKSAQTGFVEFVKETGEIMKKQKLGTLTIDSSPTDLIRDRLINPKLVAPYVNYIVMMGYDFHYMGSDVTGPVAPINGTDSVAEYDIETGILKGLEVLPKNKIILGIPSYGYEWESITDKPRALVLPDSGMAISNLNAEKRLESCATCSAQRDNEAKEAYVIYRDTETGTYHQVFYPDLKATDEKVSLALKYRLGGMAVWALGYEGNTILKPLENYKTTLQ